MLRLKSVWVFFIHICYMECVVEKLVKTFLLAWISVGMCKRNIWLFVPVNFFLHFSTLNSFQWCTISHFSLLSRSYPLQSRKRCDRTYAIVNTILMWIFTFTVVFTPEGSYCEGSLLLFIDCSCWSLLDVHLYERATPITLCFILLTSTT